MVAVGAGMIATAALASQQLARRRAARLAWLGERVVIMGGSRGLGLLIAGELVRAGASVVVTSRDPDELARAEAMLAQLAAEATQRGAAAGALGAGRPSAVEQRVGTITCDVRKNDDILQAIGFARNLLGGIDVLVNNAGIIQVGPLDSMVLEDFEEAMQVHFHGPLVATLAVLDEMRARGYGRIVNISSIGGLVSIPHLLPYSASKFALTGLSEGLRAELAQDGVLVTTVCPGLMRTGSSHRALFKGQHRKEHAWFELGLATPLTSMNAERAARRIVRACRRGAPFVVLTWQAKLLAKAHALAPNSTIRLLSLIRRALPAEGGIGHAAAEGRESASVVAPSPLTRANDRAARQNNELGGQGQDVAAPPSPQA